MKTLTIDLRASTAHYRGVQLHKFMGNKLMVHMEAWAKGLGYTHIKWLNVPLGKGTQT